MAFVNRLPTWRELNMDTSPEVDAMLCAFWREAPAVRKLKMMNQLNRTTRTLAVSGLRSRYPEASPELLRRLLADLLLGPELAEQVYGPVKGNA
jgi:hypothetical protein